MNDLQFRSQDLAKFREFATIPGWDGQVLVPAFLLKWALLHLERCGSDPDEMCCCGAKLTEHKCPEFNGVYKNGCIAGMQPEDVEAIDSLQEDTND